MKKERKIGEIFEYNGEWYQCVKSDCTKCDFFIKKGCVSSLNTVCSKSIRKDKQNVIFKKLEKVGEPISYMSRTFQKLKYPDTERCKYCYFGNQVCNPQLCGGESFLVEIKQNKEDMEEKKLNLKPFDIQKAKEGKPICTRDGHKARIICFDAKGMHQPIVALITQDNGVEYIETYYSNGRFNDDINSQSDGDLMMLPEKKEGYILLSKDDCVITDEEIAKKRCTDGYFVAKVSWEV